MKRLAATLLLLCFAALPARAQVNSVSCSGALTCFNSGTLVGTFSMTPAIPFSIIGNPNASTNVPVSTSITAYLDAVFGNTAGTILQRNTSSWLALPAGATGSFLVSNGPTQPVSWQRPLYAWGLPTQATNTVLGNVTGGNASPVPITASQLLNTIGYDTMRPPVPGSILYKDNDGTWQALSWGAAGRVLTSNGQAARPDWAIAPLTSVGLFQVAVGQGAGLPVTGIPVGNVGLCLVSNSTLAAPSFQPCPVAVTQNCNVAGACPTLIPGQCDPFKYGALGDGIHDDGPAINSCVTELYVNRGGTIMFRYGFFCVPSGVSNSNPSAPIIWQGAGVAATVLSACGGNSAPVLTVNAPQSVVRELYIDGKGGGGYSGVEVFGAAFEGIFMDVQCNECKIEHVTSLGGKSPFRLLGPDIFVSDARGAFGYGNSIMHIQGNGIRIRGAAFDQDMPQVNPNLNSLTINAWLPTHSYAGVTGADTVVVQNRGFNIQLMGTSPVPCTTGAGSSGLGPALLNYFKNIVDGSCIWQIVGNTTYYGIHQDGAGASLPTTSAGEVAGDGIDLTCWACTAGIAYDNIAGGKDPLISAYTHMTIDGAYTAPILLNVGYGFTLSDSHVSSGSGPQAPAVAINATFQGGFKFHDNIFTAGTYGIIAVATAMDDVQINHNTFAMSGGSPIAVWVTSPTASVIQGITVIGNRIYNTATPMRFDAASACDYVTIALNITNGIPAIMNCTGSHIVNTLNQ